MNLFRRPLPTTRFGLLLATLTCCPALAAQPDADGFLPLFNGRDLTGWVNANCAPETWSVRDGVIACTGKPTGALRTERHYENFILEAEWRHLSRGGNSGIFLWGTPIAAPGVPFLRGIEVQVLDHGYDAKGKNEWYTTHGDVFPIHGATMKPFGRHNGMRSFPSEDRSKPSPEWNHYRIVASNGVVRLSVNGREVSGGEDCNYRKGYLALESEGAPVEFRNLRLRELPSSTPAAAAAAVAPLDQGWRPLFTGLDLRGWKTSEATAARWKVQGERLALSAGSDQAAATLWSSHSLASGEWIIDCRLAPVATNAPAPAVPRVVLGDGGTEIELTGAEPGKYHRFAITVARDGITVSRDETTIATLPARSGATEARPLGLRATAGAAEFMNLYARPALP